MIHIEIDSSSGFCFGVTTAIQKAEEELAKGNTLYCLGDIVHNGKEVERLHARGLITINHEQLKQLHDVKVLLRAHGEPPETYETARRNNIEIIDATCPVVLQLQRRIKKQYDANPEAQIVIFGKPGHAEVLGLNGQVDGRAVVVENMQMLLSAVEDGSIDLMRPVEIFSQTTKSPAEYAAICSKLEVMMAEANELSVERFKGTAMFKAYDTICSQVASRHAKLSAFAMEHDIVIFVSGKSSSNGKVLCERCKSLNIRTYHIDSPEELRREWFRPDDRAGVCGAASTPKWLLEAVAKEILSFNTMPESKGMAENFV